MLNQFIEIPANKNSISHRKPVFGFGINDADYQVQSQVKGVIYRCPYYSKWSKMIERCYSDRWHEKHPTYKDCTVCDEWLVFSKFKCWMKKQDWKGKELDKDIISPGNKVYHPELCMFLSKRINNLTNAERKSKHGLPLGVNKVKASSGYMSSIYKGGKKVYLGTFATTKEASNAYVVEKIKLIESEIKQTADHRIKNGLRLYIEKLRSYEPS